MQTDGGLLPYLSRRLRDGIALVAVLQETTVAVSSLRMPGTAEVHPSVADIAVIEIPVWRADNLYEEPPAVRRLRIQDRVTAYHWLTAYRTNVARWVLHGVVYVSHPPAIANSRMAR